MTQEKFSNLTLLTKLPQRDNEQALPCQGANEFADLNDNTGNRNLGTLKRIPFHDIKQINHVKIMMRCRLFSEHL